MAYSDMFKDSKPITMDARPLLASLRSGKKVSSDGL